MANQTRNPERKLRIGLNSNNTSDHTKAFLLPSALQGILKTSRYPQDPQEANSIPSPSAAGRSPNIRAPLGAGSLSRSAGVSPAPVGETLTFRQAGRLRYVDLA